MFGFLQYKKSAPTTEIFYSKVGSIGVFVGTTGRTITAAGKINTGTVKFSAAGVTGDTVIVIKNNGNTIATATIATGVASGSFVITSPTIAVNDVLTVHCTQASTTNAKDMSIVLAVTLT